MCLGFIRKLPIVSEWVIQTCILGNLVKTFNVFVLALKNMMYMCTVTITDSEKTLH